MINGMLAGAFLCLYVHLVFKLIPLLPDSPWGKPNSLRDFFGTTALISVLFSLFAYAYTLDTCGTLGFFLLNWSIGLVAALAATTTSALAAYGIFFVADALEPLARYCGNKLDPLLPDIPAFSYSNLMTGLGCVLFCLLFGYLGTLKNPNCDRPVMSDVEYLCHNLQGEQLYHFKNLHNCE